MEKKIPVGILGATGIVGQRFVQMLEHHPWFELAWVAASDKSAGKSYREATSWQLEGRPPSRAAEMTVDECKPGRGPRLVFSSMAGALAGEIEGEFAKAGHVVVTNSSHFRMAEDVPLLVPEINGAHLGLLAQQRAARGWEGAIVTNPNCAAVVLVMAFAPLRRFGLKRAMVTTFQAVSGAGYPGDPSLDILGNVIPYIAKEEEKMEEETLKLLGSLNGAGVVPGKFTMSAQCNRVAVEDGHTESVSVRLKTKARPEDMIAAWNAYTAEPQKLRLPSAPDQPVVYLQANDRPQPRFDAERGAGMTTTVGRLRPCKVLDWKFTVLTHNTIRGAAGAALLNAELLKAQGYLG